MVSETLFLVESDGRKLLPHFPLSVPYSSIVLKYRDIQNRGHTSFSVRTLRSNSPPFLCFNGKSLGNNAKLGERNVWNRNSCVSFASARECTTSSRQFPHLCVLNVNEPAVYANFPNLVYLWNERLIGSWIKAKFVHYAWTRPEQESSQGSQGNKQLIYAIFRGNFCTLFTISVWHVTPQQMYAWNLLHNEVNLSDANWFV